MLPFIIFYCQFYCFYSWFICLFCAQQFATLLILKSFINKLTTLSGSATSNEALGNNTLNFGAFICISLITFGYGSMFLCFTMKVSMKVSMKISMKAPLCNYSLFTYVSLFTKTVAVSFYSHHLCEAKFLITGWWWVWMLFEPFFKALVKLTYPHFTLSHDHPNWCQ